MNCRRTRRTRHAPSPPHLDLSPIFPLKYKNKQKSRERAADATRLRGAIITFSFWELVAVVALIAARRWRLACAAIDRVLARRWRRGRVVRYGAIVGRDRRPLAPASRAVPGAGRVFHYSMLGRTRRREAARPQPP